MTHGDIAGPQIPPAIDELLEDYEVKPPPRPSSLYNAKWVFSNIAVFAVTLVLLGTVTSAAGVWKPARLSDEELGLAALPEEAGIGKWDSFEYEDLAALQAEPEPEKPISPPIGSEIEGTPQPEGGEGEHAFIQAAPPPPEDLPVPELKGKCGFESYEPSGRTRGARSIEGTMGKFGALYKLIKEAGLSANEGAGLQKSMEKFLDVKMLRAEDRIKLYTREEDGSFWFLEYVRSETTIFHFLKSSEGGIDAHEVKFPTRKEWAKAGGVVHGSLYRSAVEAGLDGSIVNHFAEVLGAYINFSEQTREGDIFKVITSSEWIGNKFMAYDPPQVVYYKGQKTGEITAILYPPEAEEPTYYKPDGLALKKVLCDVPLTTLRISSPFDLKRKHPVLKVIKPHTGTDFGAPTGTPVYAYAAGTVKVAKNSGPMGNMVHIDHGGGIESYYGHMHGFAKGMAAGVGVKKGQLIGYVGNTGRSTGPHLHFAIKKGGSFVDPMKYLSVRTTKETPIADVLQEGFIKRAKTLLAILNAIPIEDTEPPAAPPPAPKPKQEPVKAKPAGKKPAGTESKKEGHSKKSWDSEW